MIGTGVVELRIDTIFSVTDFCTKWAAENVELQSEQIELSHGFVVFKLKRNDNFASLRCFRVDRGYFPLHIYTKVIFDDEESTNHTYLRYDPHWVSKQTDKRIKRDWGWDIWTSSEKLIDFARKHDNVLGIFLSLSTVRPSKLNPLSFSMCLQPNTVNESLINEVSDLVTLKSFEGDEVKMMKSVLCAHSPVLKAALESNMLEATQGVVSMTDVTTDVLQDFSACLLSLGLPDNIVTGWRRLFNLLVVSHKYGIRPLCDSITKVLLVGVTHDNVFELLKCSDEFGLLALYRGLVYYIVLNKTNLDSLTNADYYATLPADSLRDIIAHLSVQPPSIPELYGRFPLLLQWAPDEFEFQDGTSWERLSADALRRACCERHLATSGTSAELVARLAPSDATNTDDGSEPKRLKIQ